jgi:hypothetical protein
VTGSLPGAQVVVMTELVTASRICPTTKRPWKIVFRSEMVNLEALSTTFCMIKEDIVKNDKLKLAEGR